MVTINAMEDIDVNVEDTTEHAAHKKRKLENGGSCSSDKEESELQVVDDDIDVAGEPTFIEEVMDEGGGEVVAPGGGGGGLLHVTTPVPTPAVQQPTTTAVSVISQPSSQEPACSVALGSTGALIRSMPPPPNITAVPSMMPNLTTVPNMMPNMPPLHNMMGNPTSAQNMMSNPAAAQNMMSNSAAAQNMMSNSTTAQNAMPSTVPTVTPHISTPQNVAPVIPNNMISSFPNAPARPNMMQLPNLQNNMANLQNNVPHLPNNVPNLPGSISHLNNVPNLPGSVSHLPIPTSLASPVSNPVGMTAHALLETLFAQVIAHSMNGTSGQQPNPASPNVAFSPAEASCQKADQAPTAAVPAPPVPPPENKEVPLKETLDKINILEQNTASLDKQSAGLQRIVTEVVKKQEENTAVTGMLCPRCKHYVVAGEEFISHLIVKHNFIEQKGPPQKADFGSQAGLGTCRGWRYIRTKNSGTQSTLSMVGKKEQIIDLTNSNDPTPPPDQQQPKVIPTLQSPQTSTQSDINMNQMRASPRTRTISPRAMQMQQHNQQVQGGGYDSARATAAGLLSFVFGNPEINKQFTDFAELPKEAPVRSPKKPFPPAYGHLPFLQTINKQLQAHNGLAMFDRMKEVKPMSPNITTAQQMQKELMAQALKQQQLHHQQQQQQLQQQQLQQAQQAAQQRAMHAQGSILHPSPIIHSAMQPMQQPIQPTPIQASSLQQIRPHASNFPGQSPMISVGELKEYHHMFTGGQKMNAFDESNDSPLKDCYPKVRASLVNGDIQLMWNIIGDERKCTGYRLFAYMGATAPPISSTWTEVGTVKALPMPMAVTLSQFSKGCSYHFTVRAIDSAGNLGPFSEPCSIKLSL